MKTTVEALEKNEVMLKVEVSEQSWSDAISNAYKEIASQVKISGFRKGKIPPPVIRSQVGEEPILKEALSKGLPSYYVEAVKTSGVKPVTHPQIEIVQLDETKPLKFNAKVEVEPEVKLGSHKGVEVTREPTKVSKEEVDQQLDLLREKFAQLEVVSRPIQEKDFALINFDGTIDGQPFEGGSASDYLLEIGSGTFIGGFEEQLVGANKGEIKDIWVDFPLDYPKQELACKKARFRVLVKEVKRKVLPNLNDDFTKQASKFETLAELRKEAEKSLEKIKDSQSQAKLQLAVLEKVAEKAEVEISDGMIKHHVDEALENFKADLSTRGMKFEDYLKAMNLTQADVEKDFKSDAQKGIKNRLVLKQVASNEKIETSEDEVDKEIENIAKRLNKDKAEIKKAVLKEGNVEMIKEDIILRKALNFLVERANIKDKEVTK